MRLLHTADLHLGRTFHGVSLLADQERWLAWFCELAEGSGVDAIVIAGDLYDRALPPVDAVRIADAALARLARVAPVVLISGNHDSAARLGFGSSLLSQAGLHLRTDPLAAGRPVLVGDGAIYPVPYLEPDAVRVALGCEERGHEAVLAAAMGHVRDDHAARPAGTAAVVVAHAFVAGGLASDSERDLSVGGVQQASAETFAGADYLALGHLHGPQRVGDRGRYSGSPLAFSFSEADHRKSVAVVEVRAGAEPEVELVPCPVPRGLSRVRGTLDRLLDDPTLVDAEGRWVQAIVTDAVRPPETMERLRRRFPHAVSLAFEPEGATPEPAAGGYAQRLAGLDDGALADRFVTDVRGTEPDEDERALLRDALAAQRAAEAAR